MCRRGSISHYMPTVKIKKLKQLPIHFITMVLDGMPFVRWHIDQLQKIQSPWQWHIVEGLADLKHDTAWSLRTGGRLPRGRGRSSLSQDGTTKYLDTLQRRFPGRVKIYRKPSGELWDGKVEMARAPLPFIQEECLLWQLDSDECWKAVQIKAVENLFRQQPHRTAAFFWCNFYVGPEAVVSSRHGYSQNPKNEWLRVWRYQPGDYWATHEPPRLMRPRLGLAPSEVADLRPFSHSETEAVGAAFDHYAYARREQVGFKEAYYGYRGATRGWDQLQRDINKDKPLRLSDYFSWVEDSTSVSTPRAMGIQPIARYEKGRWTFSLKKKKPDSKALQLLLDGIAYQDKQHFGVYRVWNSLLQEWARTGFIRNVKVLDRAKTFPDLTGVSRVGMRPWSSKERFLDRFRLRRLCRRHRADVFVSTWLSGPVCVPSAFLHFDFIPERLGGSTDNDSWRTKFKYIRQARTHLCISESTARDLRYYFPEIPAERIRVAHLGVDPNFFPRKTAAIEGFRRRNKIAKPYFLIVGERIGLANAQNGGRGYKNTRLFFESYRHWNQKDLHQIVLVGRKTPEAELVGNLNPDCIRWLPELSDEDLAVAYSGALALPYPSKYEGFGLPVLEAMACGCPVITTRLASLPEVGGNAPLYVDAESHVEMQMALEAVLGPAEREKRKALGLRQAKKFTWESFGRNAAEIFSEAAGHVPQIPTLENMDLACRAGWESLRTFVRTTKRRLRNSE